MFLFFACLAPAVGFGGLFAATTGNSIGTVEMVTSTAASGLIYAIFSAQPLTIIGTCKFLETLVYAAKAVILTSTFLMLHRIYRSRPCFRCHTCPVSEEYEASFSSSLWMDWTLDFRDSTVIFGDF